MPVFRPQHPRVQGFSLVELSVVIAIVSVVAVLGLETMATFMNRTAYRTTQERMVVIKAALAKHRFVYGYLPCPASAANTIASATYGKEGRTAGGVCNSSSLVANVRYGDVPVRDLGLPLSYMRDGYGSKMRYVVTTPLTVPGTAAGKFAHASSVGLLKIRTGKIEEPCNTMCQTIAPAAAYVLLSFGLDKRGTTSSNCVPNAAYDGMIDSVNCRFGNGQAVKVNGSGATAAIGDDVFYDSRYNNGTVEQLHFDDVILWQTKSQL